ncbi:MAG: hypothetical protein MJ105_06430 [Lachnospiraceae bacterium]|nr:hypothetical protein [Lachnospiraceae bacterium]
MKVVKSRRMADAIEKQLTKMGIESFLNTTVITPVTQNEVVFKERGKILDAAVDFRRLMQSQGMLYTEDESLIGAMLVSMLNESGNLNEQAPLYMNLLIKNSFVFHKGDIEANAYYQNIHFDDVVEGDFTLGHNSYAKFELFQCDLKEVAGMLYIPRLATFDHRFSYPAIMEKGDTWMSVTPGEIITMEKPIDEAKGKVLTLGLGMGYYTYMVSEKEVVSSVTVVEKSSEVIHLFEKYILPQFAHKDKITIVHGDAGEYLESLSDGAYDYAFADIWWGTLDFVEYLRLKSIARKFKKMQMRYWIGEELDFTISMSVFKLIMENHDGMVGEGAAIESYYQGLTDGEKFLFTLLEGEEVSTPERIEALMKSDTLAEIIASTVCPQHHAIMNER